MGQSVTYTATISGGTAPYTTTWSCGDGTSVTGDPASHKYGAAGVYSVQYAVVDSAGAQVQGGAGQVTVSADTIAPTVSITSLRITGTNLKVTVNATDNVAVVKTNLYIDGSTVPAATSTSPPFTMTASIKALKKGSHAAVVWAYDAAGNIGKSQPASFVK